MFRLFELAATVFEVLLIYFLLEKLLLKRSGSVYVVPAAFSAFWLGLIVVSFLPIPPILRLLYTGCGIFLLCRVCFVSSVLHAIYIGVLFCAIFLFTDLLCFWLLQLFGWDDTNIMSASAERAIYILFAKIVQLILITIASIFLRREQVLLKLKSIIPLLLCQVFSIYVCNNMMLLSRQSTNDLLSYEFILTLLGILYFNIIIVLYAEVIKLRQEERHDADLREQQLALQLSYYKSLQSEQERTRALYHDMSKHLAAMENMVSYPNKSSAAQLLLDMKDSFQEVGQLVDVGNFEVSAILNHYVQLAKDLEVPVSLSVWVPPSLSISPLDLSAVIGNTFENALEACLPLPVEQRTISLQISLHHRLFLYEISNPYLPGKKERLHTKTMYHGYGLQNVQKIVDKYNGNLRILHEDHAFTLSAYLNLPEELETETPQK